MSRAHLAGLLIFMFALGGCATRSGTGSTASNTNANQRLTTATLTFRTLQDGKDAKSSVSAQLVRNGNELGAEATSSGTEFDDNSTASPLLMSVRGPGSRTSHSRTIRGQRFGSTKKHPNGRSSSRAQRGSERQAHVGHVDR